MDPNYTEIAESTNAKNEGAGVTAADVQSDSSAITAAFSTSNPDLVSRWWKYLNALQLWEAEA
jgi:hypothetical protein